MSSPHQAEPSLQEGLARACAELERRLRSGQPCKTEDLFTAFPELAADSEAVLELVYTEFVTRARLGQRPNPADWYARFPQWQRDLEQLFQVHRAAEADRDSPNPNGPSLDRYALLGEVGRGGMGVVYKARQAGVGRLVALKVILAGEHSAPRDRARFLTEAVAAGGLQHPNIVQVYEAGEQDGRPFLAMEWVDGGSLAGKLVSEPWSAGNAARHVETLARAIQHAHDRGIVHRDLKPANILLTADGIPKITDFGLARRLPQDDTDADVAGCQTATGAVLGTPSYMAPEQAIGDSRTVGPAADIYALGAILYEILTGRPPFRGESVLDTLEQVKSQEVVAPTRLQPRLPRDLETVCLKCLDKEPRKRYASAGELADDLGRFLAGEPIRARPTRAWERTAKWARRRPAVAALLIAVIATTAAGAGAFLWSWQRTRDALDDAERARDQERDQRMKTEAALAGRTIALARQKWLTGDLAVAERLLDECSEEYRDRDWRYLHRVSHACQLTLITNLPGSVDSCLAWSPDGRLLVCTAQLLVPVVKVWDADTGHERLVLGKNKLMISQAAFVPDGRLVTVGHYRFLTGREDSKEVEIKTWATTGGEPVRGFDSLLAARVTGGFNDPRPAFATALSGDGSRLACAVKDGVRIWDVASRTELGTLPEHPSAAFAFALSPDGRLFATAAGEKGIGPVVRVRDAGSGEGVATLPCGQGAASPLAFTRDGKLLAAAIYDPTSNTSRVSVWDVPGGRELRTIRGHAARVGCVAFSPDGRYLATGSQDRCVIVWDFATGEEVWTFRGHQDRVSLVAFSPDGQRLASTSADGTVKVWDVHPLEDP